ncbi:hypothetical protein M8J77_014337 [Diaphorina citri]|jgi:hypothetical protein|nr:hypothetical protein M8J77_014337 [Diaphorina citri]
MNDETPSSIPGGSWKTIPGGSWKTISGGKCNLRFPAKKQPSGGFREAIPGEKSIRKQEEMFNSMESQCEAARLATHTHRGLGSGFGTFQYSQR